MTIIIKKGNLERIAISKFVNIDWVLQILYHLNILQNCHHHLILVLILDSIFSFIMTIIIMEGNLDRIAISKFLNIGWVLQILYHLSILQNCHHHLLLVLILDSILGFIMSHDNHYQSTTSSPLVFSISIIIPVYGYTSNSKSYCRVTIIPQYFSGNDTCLDKMFWSPQRQSYQHSRQRCQESSRSSLWTVPFSEEDKNTKSKLCVRLSFDPLSFPPKFVYKFASY